MPKGIRLPSKTHMGGYVPRTMSDEIKKLAKSSSTNQTMILGLLIREGLKAISATNSTELVVPKSTHRREPVVHIGGYLTLDLAKQIRQFSAANHLTQTSTITILLREGLKMVNCTGSISIR